MRDNKNDANRVGVNDGIGVEGGSFSPAMAWREVSELPGSGAAILRQPGAMANEPVARVAAPLSVSSRSPGVGGRGFWMSAASPLRLWLLAVVLVCAWLLPATLGHDPWKQDETYTFGIVQHMLDTGDLVVPTNAGQPFVEKPPIYYWVAASFAWLFGTYLPLHDAARLASAVFAAFALVCTARLARRISGATHWSDRRVLGALALFAGTPVVVKHIHDMFTDVALMAGAALAFCGLYDLVRTHVRLGGGSPVHDRGYGDLVADARASRRAAVTFGGGLGIAFLAKGLFVPLVFGATTFGAILLYRACRSRRFARSLGLAALCFAPFVLIWPLCLYLRSEPLFMVWFWDNNVGRFFGFSVPELGSENTGPWFVLRSALSVGFPAFPLALVALGTVAATAWRRLLEPEIALPALFAGIGFAVLLVSATARELYILPFIAPLAVLAMQGVRYVPARVHLAWDWLARIVFGLFVVLAWGAWAVMTGPVDTHGVLHGFGRWLPLDWIMPVQPNLVAAALVLTLGWLWFWPRLKAAGEWRGAFSWCLGAIVAWGLLGTLLLPWIDAAKSYRAPFEALDAKLSRAWQSGDCMASKDLGESEAPMLYYFAGVQHKPVADTRATSCTWLIEQGGPKQTQAPDGDWRLFWQGSRPGDDEEVLRVYTRGRG